HTTTGCGEQGFPSAQPYLSHTPGANPFCCMFLYFFKINFPYNADTADIPCARPRRHDSAFCAGRLHIIGRGGL
ncbi:hypothetical protein BO78DRAFT_310949, partial [Aspergillus sclerotiicarbonarius CBS 121057]